MIFLCKHVSSMVTWRQWENMNNLEGVVNIQIDIDWLNRENKEKNIFHKSNSSPFPGPFYLANLWIQCNCRNGKFILCGGHLEVRGLSVSYHSVWLELNALFHKQWLSIFCCPLQWLQSLIPLFLFCCINFSSCTHSLHICVYQI